MLEYLNEIPLPGRTLAPQFARSANRSVEGAPLGFIAGSENRLVASTMNRLMGSNQGAPRLVSLFGPTGTGKTHLAHGLVRYRIEQHGAESALYLTAVDFYRQLIDAFKRNAVGEFRSSLRGRELLVIDDLHQLPKYDYVSQELRSTLDHFQETRGTVIVTSRRPANLLANVSSDVRSRLASGLLLQLAAPGKAARVRIIRRAAESLGHALTEGAAKQIAGGIRGNTNHLFGAVFELCSESSKECSNEAVTRVTRAKRQPALRDILALVAKTHKISQAQLRSHTRRQSIVAARAMAIYLTRELAGATYDQIGRALGGRDHTTIIHSYRKIDSDRAREPLLQEEIDELSRILLNS